MGGPEGVEQKLWLSASVNVRHSFPTPWIQLFALVGNSHRMNTGDLECSIDSGNTQYHEFLPCLLVSCRPSRGPWPLYRHGLFTRNEGSPLPSLHIPLKPIQYSLPALLLSFNGVDGFSIEGDGELGLGWVGTRNFVERCRCEAITELIGEALAGVDGGVGGVEIEAKAASVRMSRCYTHF